MVLAVAIAFGRVFALPFCCISKGITLDAVEKPLCFFVFFFGDVLAANDRCKLPGRAETMEPNFGTLAADCIRPHRTLNIIDIFVIV